MSARILPDFGRFVAGLSPYLRQTFGDLWRPVCRHICGKLLALCGGRSVAIFVANFWRFVCRHVCVQICGELWVVCRSVLPRHFRQTLSGLPPRPLPRHFRQTLPGLPPRPLPRHFRQTLPGSPASLSRHFRQTLVGLSATLLSYFRQTVRASWRVSLRVRRLRCHEVSREYRWGCLHGRLLSEDTSGTSGAIGSVRANGAADGLRVCPAVYARAPTTGRELRQPPLRLGRLSRWWGLATA